MMCPQPLPTTQKGIDLYISFYDLIYGRGRSPLL